jgi:hypothetical protein
MTPTSVTAGCSFQATDGGTTTTTLILFQPGSQQQDFTVSGPVAPNFVTLVKGSSTEVPVPVGISATGGFNSQVTFTSNSPGFNVRGYGYPPGTMVYLSAPSGSGTSVSVNAAGGGVFHTFQIPVILSTQPTETITSAPAGLSMVVDGVTCISPCSTPPWSPGTPHTIGTQGTQPGTAGVQYVWNSWNDTGYDPTKLTHQVIAQPEAITYVATFSPQYQLTTSASPAGGGTLSVSPQLTWYPQGTAVSVTAVPSSGYQFSGFGGALSGTSSSKLLTINAPTNVIANFTPAGQADFTLTISSAPPPPAVSSTGQIANSGQTAVPGYLITVNPLNGFNGPVNLAWANSSSWPAGVTAAFQQTQITSSTSASFTSASPRSAPYILSFSASGGGATHGYDIIVPSPDANFYYDYDLIALDDGSVYAFFATWADGGLDSPDVLTQVQNATVSLNGSAKFGGPNYDAAPGYGGPPAGGSSGSFANFTLYPNSFGNYTFTFDFASWCCLSDGWQWQPAAVHHSDSMNYPAPSISSISATYATPGDKLDGVVITGTGLGIRSADLTQYYGVTGINVTGPGCPNSCGVTAYPEPTPFVDTGEVPAPPTTTVNAYISVAGNAQSGTYNLSVTAFGATTNPVSFTVVDSTPYISSISQSTLQSGQPGQITIFGVNFGQSCGGLACSGAGVAICVSGTSPCVSSDVTPNVVSWSDTSITVGVSDGPSASGYYDVQVTSAGAAGLGFAPAQNGATQAKSNVRSISVDGNPNLTLQVTVTGVQGNAVALNPGDCAYIDPNGPSMPQITAKIVSQDGSQVQGTATWQPKTTFNRLYYPTPSFVTARTDTNLNPFSPEGDPAGQPWTVPFNLALSTLVFGGEADLRWTYQAPSQTTSKSQPTFSFKICGKNPDLPTAHSYFQTAQSSTGTSFWFAENISIHETKEQQFYPQNNLPAYCPATTESGQSSSNVGMPFCGPPAGYGMMQLDPADSPALWNWQTNIVGGLDLLQAKAGPPVYDAYSTSAYPFWIRQVKQWQDYNGQNQGKKIPAPSDEVFPGCTFTLSPDPANYSTPNTGTAGAYWYGDAVLMKQYGGAPTNYISWISQNQNTTNGRWSWNRQSVIYVGSQRQVHNLPYEFCSCAQVPGCQNQTPKTPAWYTTNQ